MTRNLNVADLTFLFDNVLFGDTPPPGTDPFAMLGIRTIDGTNNNISNQTIVDQYGNIVDTDTFGNLNEAFFHLTSSASPLAYAAASSNPMDPGFFVMDNDPRIVSNLIADSTGANPATTGIDMLNPGDPVNDILPFNSLFTLFGQFFDHGLDFVEKGGNGVIAIPLLESDPLYDPTPGATNMMFLSRATRDVNGDAINTTAPFIEQSQTYGSHEATSFYLKEYDVNGDMTGDLVHGENSLATWADVKANALQWALAQAGPGDPVPTEMLNDTHIHDIPDPTMWDVATASFLPNAGTGQKFLADIAHNANPNDSMGMALTADADSIINPFGFGALPPASGEYDNELLDEHFIAGDPRANENVGLSAIHQAFHDEHSRIVDQIKDWVQQQDQVQPGFAAQWTGEMYFQAAKVVNEMQYQHMVFEEFGRRMSPNIDVFGSYDVNINPNIAAEFAHAVYRLGHSMQTDNVRAADSTGEITDETLIDAFLNPVLFGEHGGADLLKGAQMVQGNEIDEFVVDGLRNFLVGLPLDLAALNIARGRETGIGSLNQVRADLFAQTGDASLEAYDSWDDFAANMLNPGSLVNFIAAYSHDADITDARNGTGAYADGMGVPLPNHLDSARALAQDKIDNDATFMGVGGDQGFEDIDLWMGGLAEAKVPLGMLGSTFDFIFAQQMLALQNGDRFYYLGRVAGTNILDQIESHTFADIMSRSTGAMHLNGDAFGFTDELIELSTILMTDFTKTPAELSDVVHEIIGGTSADNEIEGGAGNDSIYGEGGEDELNGGIGDDHVYGGEGDDLIHGEGGFDFLRGDAGDDEIHGGADDDGISGGVGDDLIFGDQGFDALLGNAGNDEIHGGNQDDEIIGGEGDDELHGDAGADEIIGGEGNDVIFGGSGDDRITGDSGNDLIIGGAGADRIDGGVGGFDISSFETYNDTFASGSVSGLTINMLDPALGTGDARDDSFDGIEAVRGTIHDDTMIGDDLDNILYGGEGDDNISGGLGDDTLFGGEGDDSLFGNAGLDTAVFEGTVGTINGVGDGDYDIVAAIGGVNVVHNVTGETDFVANTVELLSFDDGLFDLAQGVFVPLVDLSAAHTQTRMQNGTEVTGELEAITAVLDGTSLAGQGYFVADINTIDPDGGGVQTFTLTGDDAAAFTIVNNGGNRELHLTGGGATSSTNFEVKPFYHVTVNVADAQGGSSVNVTLNVEDVNDNAPVITSGNRVNVNENTAMHEVLYRASSDDVDTLGGPVSYTLSGDDAGLFNMSPAGEVRFDAEANFENPLDADGDNVYELTIEATDGMNVATPKAIKVHVKDVLDSINGTPMADNLMGFVGDDVIYGFADDDEIEGLGGNDEIHGGTGTDTAIYDGDSTDYTFNIIDTNGTLEIIDNRPGSPNGTDTLYDVEEFEFDDGTFTAAQLFTNAPVVEATPADLGSTPEDSAGFIISSTDMINGAFDINGDALTVANVSVPPMQGTIMFLNSSMGVDFYNYIPALNDDTDVVISYDVTDGTNFTPYSATLDLTPVDDAPIAGAPVVLAAFDEDTSRIITNAELVANTTEVDGEALTASNVVLSTGTGSLVDNGGGTWTYTPDGNDDTDASFTFDVTDGISTISTSATLDITPVNDAPTAAPVVLAASDEDVSRVITSAELLAGVSDIDGPAAAITSLTINTGNGALVDNMDTTWTYTPAADDDTDVTFDYTATDGEFNASSTATLDITPVNDAPVAAPVVLAPIAEDSGARLITSAELLAGVSDIDGPAATITSLTINTGNGTLVDNMDTTWTYTPAADDDTDVTFDYTATDGEFNASSTATLDITPVDDPAMIGGDLAGTGEEKSGVAVTGTVTSSDIDNNDNVFIAAAAAATYGTYSVDAAGAWTYTIDDANPTVDGLDTGDTLMDSFNVESEGGTMETVDITINGVGGLLLGTPNEDVLTGTADADQIFGLQSDDVLSGLQGADILNGGGGIDTASYVGSSAAVVVDLASNFASGGDSTGDSLVDIENLIGSSHDDVLIGDLMGNQLEGGSGDDNIDGGDGSDILHGNDGIDTMNGGNGNDDLFGGAGDDMLFGGADADIIRGGAGADLINGGTGVDFASYTDATAGIGLDILAPGTNSGDATGDVLQLIENLVGSNFNDTILGGNVANTILGRGGNDVIDGRGGADVLSGEGGGDTIHGGDGMDTINGNNGNDDLFGGADNDMLFGGSGNDIIRGGAGADLINGGTGVDFVSYTDSTSGIGLDVLAPGTNSGDAAGDVLQLIENIVGSNFDDTIKGGNVANDILGRGGNDTIEGRDGADVITGGGGADIMTGGLGSDVFRYEGASQSTNVLRDTITDFAGAGIAGGDRIDLSILDADTTVGGNQAFTFIGNNVAFSGSGGELRLSGNTVEGDINGNGLANFSIDVTGVAAMFSDDFIL